MTNRAVKIIQAIFVGLAVIAAASNLREIMPPVAAAWFALLVSAGQAALHYYTSQSLPPDVKLSWRRTDAPAATPGVEQENLDADRGSAGGAL